MGIMNFLSGVGRQINPFDNGATYDNPQGNGQDKSVASQVGDAAYGAARSFAHPFSWFAHTDIINPAKEVAAELTGNKQAYQNAINSQFEGTNSPTAALRQIAGNTAQVGLTFLAPGAGKVVEGGVADALGGGVAAEIAGGAVAGGALGAPFGAAGAVDSAQPLTLKNVATGSLKGAEAGAVLGGLTAGLGEAFHGLSKTAQEAGHAQASELSGLKGANIINENEAGTLRDFASYKDGSYTPENSKINELTMQARNAAKTAGIDITSGSTTEVTQRIDNYLERRATHVNAANKYAEAGSLNNGEIIKKLAGETDVAKIKNELDGIVAPEKLDAISNAIAQTKDPHMVENILQGGTKIAPEAPPANIPAPKDVKSAIEAEVQNRLNNPAPETTPTDTSVAPPTTPDVTKPTPESAAQQVIDALKGKAAAKGVSPEKGAIAIREAQEASYSAERGARIGASQAAGADLPGLAGHQAEGAALKGELAKQQYAGLSEKLAPAAQDNLYTTLREQVKANPDIQGFQEYSTNEALRKVIYGDAGVPTRSEIALLKNAFGGDFADTVQSEIKSSLGEKAFALWRTGLLTGPQTITKIITSHLIQGGKVIADKLPTAAVDKFVSLFTGQRSTSATLRGTVEGWKLGTGDAITYLRSGVERIDPGNTLELRNSTTFNSKILQGYNDFVGRAHGSLYKPFSGAAFQNSMFDQAITAAKNAGLKGAEAESFVQDFVKNPTIEALKTAKSDANEATFQQETALGKVASAIQQKGGPLGKIIVPFTKIPSAIATDLVNYSPVGAMTTIIKGIKAATSDEGFTLADQRAFSRGLGQSITGSAAIIPGLILYNKGIMTLGYPKDPNEQKLWAAEGKIPNAVKIGGQWHSLGALGPMGSVLSIGGHIADSLTQGNDLATAITEGFVGGAQSIEEQSYLRGVSGAVNAVNDPGRYAGNFLKQTAGSIIPTGVATIAGAVDPYSRQTNSPLDTIKSRIPGVRNTLPTKIDAFGNPIKAPETGIEKILDPFQSSRATPSTQLTTALRDLQNSGHGIVPSAASKNTTFDKVKTPLPPQLLTELTTNIGQKTQDAWAKIVASSSYQNQQDPAKQKQMLQTVYDRIVAIEKTKFARQHQLGKYSPNYRANVKASGTKKIGVLQ